MDFNKLRAKKTKSTVIDPIEIFRRLPKPEGINDLYTSQNKLEISLYVSEPLSISKVNDSLTTEKAA